MGIDSHSLVSKMEGFAIQGMKGSSSFCWKSHLMYHLPGAVENHQQHISNVHSTIRGIINDKLSE